MANLTKPRTLEHQNPDHNSQGELIVDLSCDTPERNMWVGVLVVFIRDVSEIMDRDPSDPREWEIQQAWYQLHHQWMADICDFAGFDYIVFKDIMKQIIRGEREPIRVGLI